MADKDMVTNLEEILEEAGYPTFNLQDLDFINSVVFPYTVVSIRFIRNPEPGEGSKVVSVKDSQGKTHRICLRPH